jgi:hypothetical protein
MLDGFFVNVGWSSSFIFFWGYGNGFNATKVLIDGLGNGL